MGYFFTEGEVKTRPGVYQRYEDNGTPEAAGATNGIAAATIKANWGPLGRVILLEPGQEAAYGTGQTTEVIKHLFDGGAAVVKAVRLGAGGTKGTTKLKDTTARTALDAITMTLKYEGDRAFRYILRAALGDSTTKELIVYEGTTLVEKITFPSGENEVDAFIEAGKTSQFFDFVKEAGYAGTNLLANVTESVFPAGTNPVITNTDYSNAFTLLEAHRFNVLAVDTNDVTVHALVASYIDRVYLTGKMAFGVIGEPTSVSYADRLAHAKAFNNYKMIYVGHVVTDATGKKYEGYIAAARVAGMAAYYPSNQSITHKPFVGAVDIPEKLTNGQYEQAIKAGMIVFSQSSSGTVWIEQGITTLVTPTGEDDAGWKKIRRVKTRFELMTRAGDTVEPLIGNVNNNPDGRATVLQALQGLLNTMIAENKLLPGAAVKPDKNNLPAGDSAWFVFEVDDVDSLEKVYLTYKFRFAPAA